ncbi:IclR family transcriptional regulator [Nocardioides acrostichi]|uniref:IclR family transcriptional regulator n=1 Tax=Nocardioides acrostichi TaxID=2784339 RepID=A0A930UUZ6_9ACTN|nr:IclR family transcriptional regulator [Nocardioides acrostichi]MBF4161338.1 IclR family transcriptional regulator [Nocardioides acrostichi]
MAGGSTRPGVSVTRRALDLLGAFDADHRSLSLSELAQRAGLPLTTTHRLVGELVDWGALRRLDDAGYVVGRRLWDVGLLAPVDDDLVDLASPHLHDLFAVTRATVHLAVREDTEALYVSRLRGNASVPVVSTVGSRLPLHATGVGKVLLAHAPDDVAARVLGSLTRVTAYTVVQPGVLERQLTRVRRDGFATTAEEMSLGACSLAVPVRGPDDEVVAALGMVVPRIGRDRSRLVGALQLTGRSISRSLAR